ncbi:phage tail protein [Pseudoflavitalea sp. G-6-1-2]|uniref:phage tail protein n=1 Tax=Pseudoflavitalea sp. G-6-1-2 TaxID=2728841 RepID=UPI00146F2B64|nr:tail fiber protein [Pseudoflavitalea sp. G-6-1-2]NML22096.1 phage tail protein [Pseudoflavitalea sp. G-6-1-2]
MDGVIAYVTPFAGNFAPRNWAICAGQLMPIAQNTALFSLLGTNYGGNGQTTFALPDLQGRAIIGAGQGPGLSQYDVGQQGGTETVTMLTTNMPAHTHQVSIGITPGCASSNGNSNNPKNNVYAPLSSGGNAFGSAPNSRMKPYNVTVNTGFTGNTQPFSNRSPYLGMTMVICLFGVFPARP